MSDITDSDIEAFMLEIEKLNGPNPEILNAVDTVWASGIQKRMEKMQQEFEDFRRHLVKSKASRQFDKDLDKLLKEK